MTITHHAVISQRRPQVKHRSVFLYSVTHTHTHTHTHYSVTHTHTHTHTHAHTYTNTHTHARTHIHKHTHTNTHTHSHTHTQRKEKNIARNSGFILEIYVKIHCVISGKQWATSFRNYCRNCCAVLKKWKKNWIWLVGEVGMAPPRIILGSTQNACLPTPTWRMFVGWLLA